jgi:hypothetical protein
MSSNHRWRTVIFVHIPKTSGTSIHKYLKDCLGAGPSGNTIRINLQKDLTQQLRGANWRKVRYVDGHFAWDLIEDLPVEDPFIFTFLREPEERLRSWCRFHDILYFQKHHDEQLSSDMASRLDQVMTWLHNRRYWTDNLMVRQLSGHMDACPASPSEWQHLLDNAIDNLNRIDYVGFQDSFPHDFDEIIRELGLPRFFQNPSHNRTKSKYDRANILDLNISQSQELEEAIASLSQWDKKLYQYALSHRHA